MAKREDIRTITRDMLYEASEDLFTDDRLNRAITSIMWDLPKHGIYLEQLWKRPLVINQLDYTLPAGTEEIEELQINVGSATRPEWQDLKGWDTYARALWLPTLPTSTYTMRAKIRKRFTELTADGVVTDVPDNQLSLVAAGAALKGYEMLMGFFVHNKNWDSVKKPEGADMTKVANWIRQSDTRFQKMISLHRTYPKPRDIDLVG